MDEASKRSRVVKWLNCLFPDFNLPSDASEEEFRAQMLDGVVLCAILNRKNLGSIQSQRGVFISSEQRSYNLKRFISAMDEMGLPRFNASDLEQGSMSAVVDCLLSLRDRMSSGIGENDIYDVGSQPRKKWNLSVGDKLEPSDVSQGNHSQTEPISVVSRDERSQNASRNPVMPAALLHPTGYKFHEVFQLKQGRYSDLPAAKISEMMKSNSLDNAPTQSLLSVVNGILDESTERKNGEIPHRVACLLRKVVQEIERRISTQADHIRNQNNLIKSREEKYQSRIRVLETLASGTSEETQIVSNQLQKIKKEKTKIEEIKKHGDQDMDRLMREKENGDRMISELKQELENTKKSYEQMQKEKTKIEEIKKHGDQDMDRLMREKENSDRMISELKRELENTKKSYEQMQKETTKIEEIKKHGDKDMDRLMREKENSDCMISELKQELENTKKSYESRCEQLERNAKAVKAQLEDRIKEDESLLAESRKRTKELEAFSESKFQNWNKKERVFQNFIGFQLQSVKKMRLASESIKREVIRTQNGWKEEMSSLGVKLKVLVDAAENYHTVLKENRKLYNEVLELKGNIRVCCRVRPFLPGQKRNLTTVEYIRDDGEVVLVNPSKPGKDGRRMFKFNKAFGPASTQEEVYLDIQPLIRSVLDGYNVCIFAYGQTGSGKTYTMSGPNSPTKEQWGVNYRALNDLFDISRTRSNTFSYEIGVQMVEIYNEQVRDLLTSNASQRKLAIISTSQANGLAVPDASMLPVKSTSDVLELMEFGQSNRAMSSTAMNERSSRSHSVVTIHVRGVDLKTGSTSSACLHLIDLAGSERVDRSEVTGDRLKEAQHINKSLSALGDVIFALAQKSNHVPYRNSKLTQVLQSSLGGHAKTLMFVQVNPDAESYSETVSTLKFAERVSGVELGAAKSNKEGKDVRDLMEQVASLKDTIARKDEEIEELQLLKDVGAGSPNGGKSLRHSLSSPGISSTGQRHNGGLVARLTEKFASDPEELSDKHSENDSQQSADDLSDTSDGAHSMGAETEASTVDSNSLETTKERMPRASSFTSKTLVQKTGQTSARPKVKEPLKSPVLKRSTPSLTTMSSAKPFKR